jgi:hypothetical protein
MLAHVMNLGSDGKICVVGLHRKRCGPQHQSLTRAARSTAGRQIPQAEASRPLCLLQNAANVRYRPTYKLGVSFGKVPLAQASSRRSYAARPFSIASLKPCTARIETRSSSAVSREGYMAGTVRSQDLIAAPAGSSLNTAGLKA